MVSTFRGVLEFFVRLGIYDVVLPFLLVFTVVFAILEKSKVFGTEKTKSGEYTRKNLNAMVAFVVAFLVVASSRLVAIINETMANMVLLLMMSVCFLLLIGSFMKETKEGVYLKGGWQTFFIYIMFIGIVIIFLNALGWLEPAWNYLAEHYDSTVVASLLLVAGMVGFVYWIVKEPKKESTEAKPE
jgi:drug/metabolite transporter (DMT)-like permease